MLAQYLIFWKKKKKNAPLEKLVAVQACTCWFPEGQQFDQQVSLCFHSSAGAYWGGVAPTAGPVNLTASWEVVWMFNRCREG